MTDILRTWPEVFERMGGAAEFALDLETSGISPIEDSIAVVSLYDGEHTAVIHTRGDEIPIKWLADRHWVTQNGTQFDNIFLMRHHPDPSFLPSAYDTRIAESLLDFHIRSPRFNLRALMRKHLGRDLKGDVDHTSWMNPELTDTQVAYCAEDVRTLLHIRDRQMAAASRKGYPYADLPQSPPWGPDPGPPYVYLGDPDDQLDAMQLEQDIAPVVSRMILNGMPLDTDRLEQAREKYGARIKDLASLFPPGFKPGSSPQVKAIAAALGYNLPDARKATLLKHDDPALTAIVELKQANKRMSMFSEEWVEEHVAYDGRIHPFFSQLGTATSRFSCRNPNMQQVPRNMRDLIALEGYDIITLDFAQQELRIGAVEFNDDILINALEHEDVHANNVDIGFPFMSPDQKKLARNPTKPICFNWFFGGGPDKGIARAQNIFTMMGIKKDPETAIKGLFSALRREYVGVTMAHRRMRNAAQRYKGMGAPLIQYLPHGYRRVHLPRDLRATRLINTMIQMPAALMMKLCLSIVPPEYLPYLIATVHDEIVFCAPKDISHELAEYIVGATEQVIREVYTDRISFPMEWSVTDTWPAKG